MEKNQKTIEENNNIPDYQPVNQVNKTSYLKEKSNKFYNDLCKTAVQVGTMALIGTNYSKALEYTSNLQSSLLQKSLENQSMIGNIISSTLQSQYLDDLLVAGGATIAFITARNIAETYNPVEKGLNLTGKGAYKGLKFTGKSAYNGGKYFIDGLRDFVGEGIIAAFAPKSKLRKIISTNDTYESNVMRDNERNRRKINKIQELKIKDSDKIVEDTNLNQQNIEKANYKIQKLEEKIIQA